MPKGSKVMGMIISANRDEAVFDRPDALTWVGIPTAT